MKLTLKEDNSFSNVVANIISTFIGMWIVMLALGALGIRLHIPFLRHLDYWDVFLIRISASLFRRNKITQWIVEGDGLPPVIQFNVSKDREKK